MKEYFAFYVLFVILIVLLIFVLLLYSDYKTATIVPGLADSYFKVKSFDENDNSLTIQNNSGIAGFDSSLSLVNTNQVNYKPLQGDEKRRLRGVFTLVLSSSNPAGDSISLQITDVDSDVTDYSDHFIPWGIGWGPTVVRMVFDVREYPYNDRTHLIGVNIKAQNKNTTIETLLLRSAHISYY
jgi:hypothetical protein